MRTFLVWFLSFWLGLHLQGFCSHIAGAELTYAWVRQNTYSIHLKVYRDCSGGANLPQQYEVLFQSNSCGINGKLNVLLEKPGSEIGILCKGQQSTCTGGSMPGIQAYSYRGQIDLPISCKDYIFSWTDFYRNSSISTFQNPGASYIYLEAFLNAELAPRNHSPTFQFDPIVWFCNGQTSRLHQGTVDQDQDRLVYRLIAPKVSATQNVQYIQGYSATQPIPTNGKFTLDSMSGMLTCTPSANIQSGYALLVEEYRNQKLIGSVIRDLNLNVSSCINRAPSFSGLNGTNSFNTELCLQSQSEIFFLISDPNLGDSLDITFEDNRLQNADIKYTKTSAGIRCNIRFASMIAGTFTFVVRASDNGCPLKASSSQMYTIHVRPNPVISFASLPEIICTQQVILAPQITSGRKPFRFLWENKSTSSSIRVGIGKFGLQVTDSLGCVSYDTARVRGIAMLDIIMDTRTSDVFEICPSSVHKYNIVLKNNQALDTSLFRFQWKTHNKTTGNKSHIQLKYPAFGNLFDTLIAVDTFGCVQQIVKNVRICQSEKPKLVPKTICQSELVDIVDTSTVLYSCPRQGRVDFGDGRFRLFSSYRKGDKFDYRYKDPGVYRVRIEFTSGCNYDSGSTLITVLEAPKSDLKSFTFRCDRGDTILIPSFTKGRAPFKIKWNGIDSSTQYIVRKPQSIALVITDSNACVGRETIDVSNSIKAIIQSNGYCEKNDEIVFQDISLGTYGIKSRQWTLSDSTTSTSIQFRHAFARENIYFASLVVEDLTGCKDSVTEPVVVLLPTGTLNVLDDTLCAQQILQYDGPVGGSINRWTYDMGNQVSIIHEPSITMGKGSYVYPIPGTYTIQLSIQYNDQKCTKQYSRKVHIMNPFEMQFNYTDRLCFGYTTSFSASKTKGDYPLQSIQWQFTNDTNEISTQQNPIYFFKKNGLQSVRLKATDTQKCTFQGQKFVFVSKLDTPCFFPTRVCTNQGMELLAQPVCNQYENFKGIRWSINGQITSSQNPFIFTPTTAEIWRIQATAFTQDSCNISKTQAVESFSPPIASFKADTVCFGLFTQFTAEASSASTPKDPLVDYIWYFGDGDSLRVQQTNIQHLYKNPGFYTVILKVRSALGCFHQTQHMVWVKPRPDAQFEVEAEALIKGEPVPFFNRSTGQIVRWTWEFGDGSSTTLSQATDPIHVYKTIEVYTARLLVLNEVGCFDTLSKTIDLNTYMVLPTAFSPNGDGLNDEFKLMHKGIRNLEYFSVFNRWGEKVFETRMKEEGWNGTWRGYDQPPGVYLFQAKGKDVYGIEKLNTGSVTLIR